MHMLSRLGGKIRPGVFADEAESSKRGLLYVVAMLATAGALAAAITYFTLVPGVKRHELKGAKMSQAAVADLFAQQDLDKIQSVTCKCASPILAYGPALVDLGDPAQILQQCAHSAPLFKRCASTINTTVPYSCIDPVSKAPLMSSDVMGRDDSTFGEQVCALFTAEVRSQWERHRIMIRALDFDEEDYGSLMLGDYVELCGQQSAAQEVFYQKLQAGLKILLKPDQDAADIEDYITKYQEFTDNMDTDAICHSGKTGIATAFSDSELATLQAGYRSVYADCKPSKCSYEKTGGLSDAVLRGVALFSPISALFLLVATMVYTKAIQKDEIGKMNTEMNTEQLTCDDVRRLVLETVGTWDQDGKRPHA